MAAAGKSERGSQAAVVVGIGGRLAGRRCDLGEPVGDVKSKVGRFIVRIDNRSAIAVGIKGLAGDRGKGGVDGRRAPESVMNEGSNPAQRILLGREQTGVVVHQGRGTS